MASKTRSKTTHSANGNGSNSSSAPVTNTIVDEDAEGDDGEPAEDGFVAGADQLTASEPLDIHHFSFDKEEEERLVRADLNGLEDPVARAVAVQKTWSAARREMEDLVRALNRAIVVAMEDVAQLIATHRRGGATRVLDVRERAHLKEVFLAQLRGNPTKQEMLAAFLKEEDEELDGPERKRLRREAFVLQDEVRQGLYPDAYQDNINMLIARTISDSLRDHAGTADFVHKQTGQRLAKAEFAKMHLLEVLQGTRRLPNIPDIDPMFESRKWRIWVERRETEDGNVYHDPVIEIECPWGKSSPRPRRKILIHCRGLRRQGRVNASTGQLGTTGTEGKLQIIRNCEALGFYSNHTALLLAEAAKKTKAAQKAAQKTKTAQEITAATAAAAEEAKVKAEAKANGKGFTKGALTLKVVRKPNQKPQWKVLFGYQTSRAARTAQGEAYASIHRGVANMIYGFWVDPVREDFGFFPYPGKHHADFRAQLSDRYITYRRRLSNRKSRVRADAMAQPGGRRKAAKAIRRLADVERKFTADTLWRLARATQRDLVEKKGVKLLVCEEFPKTFRSDIATGAGKKGRFEAVMPAYVRNFPYGDLKAKIEFACRVRAATDMEFLPMQYISQECPACGHTARGNVSQLPRVGLVGGEHNDGLFNCEGCAWNSTPDKVAAVNLLLRATRVPAEVKAYVRAALARQAASMHHEKQHMRALQQQTH